MSVYVASDLHLGHRFAATSRGFITTEDHDRHIIRKLSIQCGKRDLLWVLGDVAWNEESLSMLSELKCDMKMVRGNHDNLKTDAYLKYFNTVEGFLRYKKIWLSHCPIHPQEIYRCRGNVHGHIHKGAATKPLPYPYFNVNWDFWDRAVQLEEIYEFYDRNETTQA